MATKSIIIIGAGMGGLAAGIYGQLNGYTTRIFEMHCKPGGQCAAWRRQGYLFDGCIHHLFGCDPSSRIYDLWFELGAMPRDLVPIQECVSVVSPDGRLFHDYYNLERLEHHLRELSPGEDKVGGRKDVPNVFAIRGFLKQRTNMTSHRPRSERHGRHAA